MQEKVTLNRKEQTRAMVINEMEKGKLGGKEAAVILGISLRQLRRITAAYREVGIAALAHGNRGRGPVNRIKDEVRQVVIELAGSKYAGFNQQHFTEFLEEAEGIVISRSSVRNILLDTGIRSPRRRRPPQHRSRRERYPQEGMLLQVDGSPYDWLEGRGSRMNLVGAIDDATGKVPYAVFREQEDSRGYFLLLAETIKRKGIPLAIYHDRHSIFEIAADKIKRQSIPDQLTGKPLLTQFGRVMAELGITPITARTPQAKGRIERLWGTFQDRLTSELRLAGICSLEDANQFLAGFLDRYNTRFAVTPEEAGSAYRPAQGLELEKVFCFKYDRVVGTDNVVRFGGNRLQILPSPDRRSYARCPVQVHEQLDGNLKIYYQGSYLEVLKAPPEATKLRELVPAKLTQSPQREIPVTKPAPDHPWRRWVYRNHNRINSE